MNNYYYCFFLFCIFIIIITVFIIMEKLLNVNLMYVRCVDYSTERRTTHTVCDGPRGLRAKDISDCLQ